MTVTELAAANQMRDQREPGRAWRRWWCRWRRPPCRRRTLLYTTRRGDTLVTIADRFGVSLNQLRRWNKITGIKVAQGRRLHVSEPTHARTATRSHRGGASAQSGSNAHKTLPAKDLSARPRARAAQKHGITAGKNQHSGKSAGSVGSRKSATQGARK